jgi:anti-sigma factor RsiW
VSGTREPIAEIDLLAYADGLLDGDVQRKEAVERYLSEHPKWERYVADILEQNDAIREHYGPLLREPVPERHISALHSERSLATHGRTTAKAAAVAVLLLASSAGGWLIGKGDPGSEWEVTEFVERAAAFHNAAVDEAGGLQAAASGNVLQPLGWLNRRIALELAVPELTAEGFELVAKERLDPPGDPMVRLVYKRSDGASISLFLRPRWEEDASRIIKAEENDVAVLYWLDGPLAFAMTTDAPETETDYLARVVREAVGRARLNDGSPAMALSPGAGHPAAHATEGSRSPMPAPAKPDIENGAQQRQFN